METLSITEKFILEIKENSKDSHDIESAYEETIEKYERMHPDTDWSLVFCNIEME